jgi:hypothetical protein
MVDRESHDIASEPVGGAPSNRDRRPNDTVIEGEIASPEAGAPAAAEPDRVGPEAQETRRPPPEPDPPAPPPRPPRAGRAFAAGAAGGAVVAALAAAAGFYLFLPQAGLSEDDASRLGALETAASRDDAAIASLDKRIGAVEGAHTSAALAAVEKRVGALETNGAASGVAGLDKRVGALETNGAAYGVAGLEKRLAALEAANAVEGPKIEADTHTAEGLSGDVKTLRADIDAARGEIPGLAARVGKLETGVASADLGAVSSRIDKLESALAAPKTETRVAPENPSANNSPAAAAIVAETARDKLATGAAFPTELAALSALGVDPAKLAPLKALVDGAPTDRALAASFEAAEPKIFSAVGAKETGGIADRLLAHLRGLVQVRRLGETEGDDPQALASQVVANLRRGDLDGALAAFGKLPEPARQAASAWEAEAKAKQAALAAVRSIREAAMARLVQSGKS